MTSGQLEDPCQIGILHSFRINLWDESWISMVAPLAMFDPIEVKPSADVKTTSILWGQHGKNPVKNPTEFWFAKVTM